MPRSFQSRKRQRQFDNRDDRVESLPQEVQDAIERQGGTRGRSARHAGWCRMLVLSSTGS
jgi:hypothetical protein